MVTGGVLQGAVCAIFKVCHKRDKRRGCLHPGRIGRRCTGRPSGEFAGLNYIGVTGVWEAESS